MYLLQVLALELSDQLVQALVVCVDADRLENTLDIFGRRGGVATEAKKEVCCEVLHDDCSASCVSVATQEEQSKFWEVCTFVVDDVSNERFNRFNREMSGD